MVWCVTAAGISAALISAPVAGAATTTAPVDVNCLGLTSDQAGVLSGAPQTSQQIIKLALQASGLDPVPSQLPPFPTTVTTDAPQKVAVNSGDIEVNFTYRVGVPSVLANLAIDKLALQNLLVQNLTAGVEASSGGTVTAKVSAVAADTTLALADSSSVVTVSMKLTVGTSKPGRIFFRPSPMTLQLNFGGLSVAKGLATIDTASAQCDVGGVIASTSVQVKGTPSTPAVVDGGTVQGGDTARIPLLGRSDFLLDDGNPILSDSLRILTGAGGATIANGGLVQPTAAEGGTYLNEVEICGASRVTPDTPGINEVQTMKFPSYTLPQGQEWLNPHPLGMRLTFDGQETAEIPLSTVNWLLGEAGGQFQAPDPKAFEKALVALPNIDAGDISVTRDPDGTYKFTFTGKLGGSPQPEIGLAGWRTQLDYASYDAIQKAISGILNPPVVDPPGPGGPAGPPDPAATELTLDQLAAELNAGHLTINEYFAKFGNALKNSVLAGLKPEIPGILTTLTQLFPQKPEFKQPGFRKGEKLIPGEATGPLCTSFFVKTVATPKTTVLVAAGPRVVPPCKVTGRSVKTRVAFTSVVGNRKRTKYRTVKVIRTVRSGGCPQAIVLKAGKITLSDLPVRGAKPTSQPKKVTLTITARGLAGKATGTFKVSSTTGAASGTLTLPAALAGAGRLTVSVGGPGVAKQTRTLLPS